MMLCIKNNVKILDLPVLNYAEMEDREVIRIIERVAKEKRKQEKEQPA